MSVLLIIALVWTGSFWYLRNPAFSFSSPRRMNVTVDPLRLREQVTFLSTLKPNRSFSHYGSLLAA